MGTVVLIGASRGIGLELAAQYVRAGERVIATARDEAGLARLAAVGVVQTLRVDVSDPASVSGLAWQLGSVAIDLALYVAGQMSRADATMPPTQPEFDRVMHANVLGAMQIIPQLAPGVEQGRAGQGGTFAFISSAMGRMTETGGSDAWLYRVSKAALNMAVVSAQHSYPTVSMVLVHPGWVRTDMGGDRAPLSVQDSATGIRQTLDALTPAAHARFVRYDGTEYQGW